MLVHSIRLSRPLALGKAPRKCAGANPGASSSSIVFERVLARDLRDATGRTSAALRRLQGFELLIRIDRCGAAKCRAVLHVLQRLEVAAHAVRVLVLDRPERHLADAVAPAIRSLLV